MKIILCKVLMAFLIFLISVEQSLQQFNNGNNNFGRGGFRGRPSFGRPNFAFPNNFEQNGFDPSFQQQQLPQPQQLQQQLSPGEQLVFTPSNRRPAVRDPSPVTTTTAPGQLVFINNRPTVATVPPFMTPTTPSTQFTTCFNSCQTTPEYNPICASNQQLYFNEQKFNCAQRCGADIQIVRRGSCEGLFPMMRG